MFVDKIIQFFIYVMVVLHLWGVSWLFMILETISSTFDLAELSYFS